MSTPTIWASCFACAYTYDDTQPMLYVDHLEAHVRAYRDEVKVTGMRQRDLEAHLRHTGDTMVATGRELLAVVS